MKKHKGSQKEPVNLVLVDHGHIELVVMPVGPWHSFNVCDYLNQGLAYIDGDRIYKRGIQGPPSFPASLMGRIIERATYLPNNRWEVESEVKKQPELKPFAPGTFRLVARNVAAGKVSIVCAKGWSPSYICELLNMGIAVFEVGGKYILKHNGTGFSNEWSNVARITVRHHTAAHYRWHLEADASRKRVRKPKQKK